MRKTILLTGASRGIGLAIAKQLLVEGHEVIGLSRTHSLEHDNYTPIQIDLSDLKSLPDRLKKIQSECPEIDALICNAGIWHYCQFEDLSYRQIRHIHDLNFLSPVYLVKAFLPQLKAQNRGDILFIGSESARSAPPMETLYSATKSALATFARALRSECASENIRVTTIHPGAVKTDMLDLAPSSLSGDETHHIVPEDVASIISFLLNGREGTVLDEIHLSPQKNHINILNN